MENECCSVFAFDRGITLDVKFDMIRDLKDEFIIYVPRLAIKSKFSESISQDTIKLINEIKNENNAFKGKRELVPIMNYNNCDLSDCEFYFR